VYSNKNSETSYLLCSHGLHGRILAAYHSICRHHLEFLQPATHRLYEHFTYPHRNITKTKDWITTDYLGIGLNHNLKNYIYNVLFILLHLVLTSTNRGRAVWRCFFFPDVMYDCFFLMCLLNVSVDWYSETWPLLCRFLLFSLLCHWLVGGFGRRG